MFEILMPFWIRRVLTSAGRCRLKLIYHDKRMTSGHLGIVMQASIYSIPFVGHRTFAIRNEGFQGRFDSRIDRRCLIVFQH